MDLFPVIIVLRRYLMISKAYEKIKNFIRDNYKYILVWILIYLFFTIPTNSYVIVGGGTININKRVQVENEYKQKGKLNFAYVEELKGTVATYLLSLIVPGFENESIDEYRYKEDEDYKDLLFREKMNLEKANADSVYVAYTKAKRKISIKDTKLYIIFVDDNKNLNTNLKIGDQILEVDGQKINGLDDYRTYINSKEAGEKVTVLVKEKKEVKKKFAYIYQQDDKLVTGIGVIEINTYKLDPKLKLKFKKSESGPSGGLMLALQIYNKLTKKDITKGRNIVGTGTIDKDGRVGDIGGIKYKLRGAVKKRADIFICPKDNLKEALKEKKKRRYKIKVIGVSSFDEVIERLK